MRGVAYVALGHNAQAEMKKSRATLKDLPVHVFEEVDASSSLTVEQQAHLAKTRVFDWSPYPFTLLLDADTRVHGDLSIGFELLERGWDIVMVPSFPPREGVVLWHLSAEERSHTLNKLGDWNHIMHNTGVLFFRKSRAVKNLFSAWEAEWTIYRDRDQGAFLRALRCNPVYKYLLGAAYNSKNGAFVEHLFGKAV